MKSRIQLQKFYDYVFGDSADLEKRTKGVPAEHKGKRVEAIQKEIKDFFQGLNIPEQKQIQFRKTLREMKAANLETILFKDSIDQLNSLQGQHHAPDDKMAIQHYESLNREFKIFPEAKDVKVDDKSIKFSAMFKTCKLFGDFVECNNDITSSVAANHAYKMLTVFESNLPHYFDKFDHYLRSHNLNNVGTPVHDALIYSIPKLLPDSKVNLPAWQAIIQKAGSVGFRLFNMAPEIEKKLERAPKTYEEALKTAQEIRYKVAARHPELATLCMAYNQTEDVFNTCLEVDTRRKKADNLPAHMVDGKDVKQDGFYLVKLPIDDPRAYLLGHITNCCQSIGGHSEQCVIDGVTRPNNGYYVLLRKTEEKGGSPLINGKIDYKNFKIVGQGYAWLSIFGNLTFDSWENIQPEYDRVIVSMLEKFAQDVTQHFNITKVSIGQGGKTPQIWKDQESESCSEGMKEGEQYGDSKSQNVIYRNNQRLAEAVDSLQKSLATYTKENKNEAKVDKSLFDNNMFSVHLARGIEAFLKLPEAKQLFSEASVRLKNENFELPLILFGLLESEGIRYGDIYKKIFSFPSGARESELLGFFKTLVELKTADLLGLKYIRDHLAQNQRYFSIKIIDACSRLNKIGLLQDDGIREVLFSIKDEGISEAYVGIYVHLKNNDLLQEKYIIKAFLDGRITHDVAKDITTAVAVLKQEKLLENPKVHALFLILFEDKS